MSASECGKIGYVVKRYPRFSETFIVNEILAHEEADCDLEIFALRPCCDAHFQDRIARVRANVNYLMQGCTTIVNVNYLPPESPKANALWRALHRARNSLPRFEASFDDYLGASVQEAYQALHLAEAVAAKGIKHLHAHFATSAAEVTRLAAQLAGVSFTLTAHAKDIFHEDVQFDDLNRKLRSASQVITVSDFNVQYLSNRYPNAGERIVRLFNGIDLQQFAFDSPKQRDQLIVAVGRLVEKNGFTDLVAADRL